MSHVDVLKRFTTRLADNGAKAWKDSGPVTRTGALLTTSVTGTAGIAAGGLVGAYDRVWNKISDTTSKGRIESDGKTVIIEASPLTKTAAYMATVTGLSVALAYGYDAYALATGAGLVGAAAAMKVGFAVAVGTWTGFNLLAGAWAGAKLGAKGGFGLACSAARRVAIFFEGEKPTAIRPLTPPG